MFVLKLGLLGEALDLIETIPFEPNATSWKSLLCRCSIRHSFEFAKISVQNLPLIYLNDTAAYIWMFNLDTSFGNRRLVAAGLVEY